MTTAQTKSSKSSQADAVEIIDAQTTKGALQYKVRWAGTAEEKWMPAAALMCFPDAIAKYDAKVKRLASIDKLTKHKPVVHQVDDGDTPSVEEMNEMLKMVNSTEIPNDSIYNTEQDTSAVTTPAPVVQDSHPAAAKKPNKLKVRASDESTVDLAPPPPAKKRSGPRTKVTIADEHEVVDAPTSEQDARVWGNFKMLAHLIEAISCANDEIYGTRAAIENIDTAASTLVSSFIHGPDRNFAEISPASSRAFNAINTGIARQATGCSKWWVQVVCVKSYMCPGLVGMLERFIESDALTRDELASKSHVNDQNIATFIVNCSDWSMETREFLFKNHGDVAVADTATKKLMDAKRLRDMIIPKREHEVDIQAVTSAAIASVHAFDTLIDAAIEREHLTVLMALVISRPKAAILNEGWDTTKLFNFFSDVKERNPNDVGWTGECLVDAMKGLLKPSAL